MPKLMTELETLKTKKGKNKATAKDLTRLKELQDGEPLSAQDLQAAKDREAQRHTEDVDAFNQRKKIKPAEVIVNEPVKSIADGLDQPAEHPRITALKEALRPFTQIEAHDSRPNEFVLFTRGISITAGDIRTAQKAMKI